MSVCVRLFLPLQAITLSNTATSCADHPLFSVLRTNVSFLLHFVRPLCLYCLIGRMSSLWLFLTLLKPCRTVAVLEKFPPKLELLHCIASGLGLNTGQCEQVTSETSITLGGSAIRTVSQLHSCSFSAFHAQFLFCYTSASCFPRPAG